MRFLYVDSESERIVFLPRNHRYIGDVCFSNGYIYYSTENDKTTIWRIKASTGQLDTFEGYYPNVELFEIIEGNKVFILMTEVIII
jgi:hypothetical protein